MPTPTLLSIQVGLPAEHGADHISKQSWESGIFKYPVEGRVWLDSINLKGDGQRDLENHGGPFRAVLSYSADLYPEWREELGRPDLPYGSFGENFTISGLDETTVCLGDVYAIGQARLRVSQPRFPCWKLARRNGIKDLTARVDKKMRGGWYQQVLKEGYVEARDTVQMLERPYPQYPIRFIFALGSQRIDDRKAAAELATISALTDSWREIFAERAAQ
jgi:MOSC domain-containing protein YiiM